MSTNTCRARAGAALLAALGLAMSPAASADSDAELAKKAQNPIAAMISLPLQLNYDEGYGATGDGEKWLLNVQPVIPFDLNADWNLISRTIVPLIDQKDFVAGGALDESGVGDVLQSLFFSPKAPTAGGWIWGVGPALLLPTASDRVLSGEKWALGPTAVVLKQESGWTVGVLGNHLWSVAGEDDRDDISATLVQPFLGYTTRTYTTFMINRDLPVSEVKSTCAIFHRPETALDQLKQPNQLKEINPCTPLPLPDAAG